MPSRKLANMAKKKISKNKKTKNPNSIFIRILFTIIILAIIGYGGYWLYQKIQADMNIKIPNFTESDDTRIKIQVFNGCRNTQAALDMSKILRKSGLIDVADLEKSPSNIYPHTMIIDRKGNPEKMKELAEVLGLPDDRITIMKSNQFLDATLVVGVDFQETLSLLREKYDG